MALVARCVQSYKVDLLWFYWSSNVIEQDVRNEYSLLKDLQNNISSEIQTVHLLASPKNLAFPSPWTRIRWGDVSGCFVICFCFICIHLYLFLFVPIKFMCSFILLSCFFNLVKSLRVEWSGLNILYRIKKIFKKYLKWGWGKEIWRAEKSHLPNWFTKAETCLPLFYHCTTLSTAVRKENILKNVESTSVSISFLNARGEDYQMWSMNQIDSTDILVNIK